MATQFLKPGTPLLGGKYRIIEFLGQGGFGIAYKAMMKEAVSGKLGAMEVDVPVAIKEFFMEESCQRDENTFSVSVSSTGSRMAVEQYRRKFVKEANNMAGLSHPNIVKVIDVFKENNTDYYVMQYLEGGSLRDYVKKHGSLSEDEAIDIVRKIGDALHYMHTQKYMCHYDVKPRNILLDRDGNPKLIDFGISKSYDEKGNQKTSSTPVGVSKGYAPSEQYEQSVRELSPQTDVYALGATLYYLLTDTVPPDASSVLNNGLPPLPSSVSPQTKAAIEAAMQPKKRHRPQTMAAFLQLLSEEDEDTHVMPKGEIVSPDRKDILSLIKNWKSIIVGIAAAMVVFCCIILFSKRTSDDVSGNDAPKIVEKTDDYNLLMKEEVAVMEVVLKRVQNRYFESGIGACSYTGLVDSDDKPHGIGTATFSDGRVYEGNFEHGVMTGKAQFRYGNGDTFEGTFSNNTFKEGTYTVKSDGSRFIGTFRNGKTDRGQWYESNDEKQ